MYRLVYMCGPVDLHLYRTIRRVQSLGGINPASVILAADTTISPVLADGQNFDPTFTACGRHDEHGSTDLQLLIHTVLHFQ